MLCSIVIPVYNNAPHLPACLDSILAQDLAEWECILVDDGSSDDSVDVCRRYCGIDARFRLLTLSHAGGGAARDAGFREAKGDFIFYSDADDVLHPSLISASVTALDTTLAQFVNFDCVPFSGEFDPSLFGDVTGAPTDVVHDPFRVSLDEGWGRAMWRYFYRREALHGVWSGSKFTRCVDRHFSFTFLKKGLPCARLHAALYFYRQHAQSQVRRPLAGRDVEGYVNYMRSITSAYRGEPGKLRMLRRREFVPLVKSIFRKALGGTPDEMLLVAKLIDTLRGESVLRYRDFSLNWAFRIWRTIGEARRKAGNAQV